LEPEPASRERAATGRWQNSQEICSGTRSRLEIAKGKRSKIRRLLEKREGSGFGGRHFARGKLKA